MALRKNDFLFVGLFVLYYTWGVWAQVEVVMEDRVEVLRGAEAQIACTFKSADGSGGLIIQWFTANALGTRQRIYYQDPTMSFDDNDTPFSGRISVSSTGTEGELVLTIKDVRLEDELDYYCLVQALTEGKGEGRTQLRVFVAPEFPTIEGVTTAIHVDSEDPKKVGSCEAKNGYPKHNITWYRDLTPLRNTPEVLIHFLVTTEYTGLFSVKSDLYLKVKKEDKDAQFYCEVSFNVPGWTKMTETDRINITVNYPTTTIDFWVQSPTRPIREGDTVELHCLADGNPQPKFTFKHGEVELSSDDQRGGVLVLQDVSRLSNGDYHCITLNTETFEDIIGSTKLTVNYLDPAVVVPGDNHVMEQGGELNATCNALSSLPTETAWLKNGKPVATGHTLVLKDAGFDTAGIYVCVITVPDIPHMETSGTLQIIVLSPPVVSPVGSSEIEALLDKMVNLSCEARGLPLPSISWSSSDAQVVKAVTHQTEGGVLSIASLKVTSDITAFCNASNEQGADATSFTIKAILPTTTAPTTTAPTTTSSTTAKNIPSKNVKEGSGVIIPVIIVLLLLLAVLGSVLYFLYKKGKICGRSGKQDLTKEKSNKDIVVEMKGDNKEEAVLLGVNGEKKPPGEQ